MFEEHLYISMYLSECCLQVVAKVMRKKRNFAKEFGGMAIPNRGNSNNLVQWDLGTVTLGYYVGEGEGEATEGWSFQRAGLEGQLSWVLFWTVLCTPHFQKCLLFSKQFMHQGNVAETTRAEVQGLGPELVG